MKYLVVLALCAAAAFAEIITDKNSLNKFQQDCIQEYNLDEADLELEEVPFKNTCFYACFAKKMGLMKQDGTFDVEDMIAGLTRKAAARYLINKLLLDCYAQGAEPCKVALCFMSKMAI